MKNKSLLLLLAALLLATVATAATPTPKEISKWKIPGQRVQDQCLKYAFCINVRLAEAGVEAQMLEYNWPHKGNYSHAVVLFRIDAQWYLIDNETDKAAPVSGTTTLERVRSWDKDATTVKPLCYNAAQAAAALAELSTVAK